MRGGQPGTRSGNSARSRLDQVVELLGHGIVPASGVVHVQPAVGVGLAELVADGRVGAALQEQADHLEMTVRDRPVQAGAPEVGRDVGADAEVKEPAHDLGPAVLAGVDERLGDDLLRIVGRLDPRRNMGEVGGVGARGRGVRPQPAVRIETGPHKIQPAARGIGPERLRDNPVFGEQAEDRQAAGTLWQDHGLAFASAIGTPLDSANVRREFRKITEAAGLGTGWAPRDLRHTFVSLMSADGVPIEEIARLAGHNCTATTELVYRHELHPAPYGSGSTGAEDGTPSMTAGVSRLWHPVAMPARPQ